MGLRLFLILCCGALAAALACRRRCRRLVDRQAFAGRPRDPRHRHRIRRRSGIAVDRRHSLAVGLSRSSDIAAVVGDRKGDRDSRARQVRLQDRDRGGPSAERAAGSRQRVDPPARAGANLGQPGNRQGDGEHRTAEEPTRHHSQGFARGRHRLHPRPPHSALQQPRPGAAAHRRRYRPRSLAVPLHDATTHFARPGTPDHAPGAGAAQRPVGRSDGALRRFDDRRQAHLRRPHESHAPRCRRDAHGLCPVVRGLHRRTRDARPT